MTSLPGKIAPLFNFYLIVSIFLLPLILFPPLTNEFLKSSFLIMSSSFLIVLFSLKAFLTKAFKFTFTPFYYLMLSFLLLELLSVLFSLDQRVSLGVFFNHAALAVLLFTAVSIIRSPEEVVKIILALTGSSVILSLIVVLQALSVANFSLPDSPTNLAFFIGCSALLTVGLALYSKSLPQKITLFLILALYLLSLSLIASLAQLVFLAFSLGIFLLFRDKFENKTITNLSSALAFFLIGVIVVVRLLNLLPSQQLSEVRLPLKSALAVSTQTVLKKPLFGSGLGTFSFDFRKFRPRDLTHSSLWNVSFNESYSSFFDNLATIGVTGTLGFLAVLIVPLLLVLKYLKKLKEHRYNLITVAAFSALAFSLSNYFLINFKLLSTSLVFLLLMLLLAYLKSIGVNWFKEIVLSAKYLGIGVLIFSLLISLTISFFNFKNLLAEYYFRQSLQPQNLPAQVYNSQIAAVRNNPNHDLYHRQFSITNLALALATLSDQGLSNEDKLKNGRTLIDQAINEGKAAQKISPHNSLNAESLGQIYLALSPSIKGASEASINSFKQALELNPRDPILYLSLAKALQTTGNLEEALTNLKIAANYLPKDSKDFKEVQTEIEKLNK